MDAAVRDGVQHRLLEIDEIGSHVVGTQTTGHLGQAVGHVRRRQLAQRTKCRAHLEIVHCDSVRIEGHRLWREGSMGGQGRTLGAYW